MAELVQSSASQVVILELVLLAVGMSVYIILLGVTNYMMLRKQQDSNER